MMTKKGQIKVLYLNDVSIDVLPLRITTCEIKILRITDRASHIEINTREKRRKKNADLSSGKQPKEKPKKNSNC